MAQGESTEWYDLLGRFKAKAAEFSSAYTRVVNSQDAVKNNPELLKERAKLLTVADKVKTTVEGLTQSVDTAYNFLKNTMGLGNYANEMGSNALGALPLIPLAASGIAIAGMTKVISDSLIYLDKVDRYDRLEKEHGPEKALRIFKGIADATKTPAFGIELGKSLAPLLLIAGGVYFFRDKIFK